MKTMLKQLVAGTFLIILVNSFAGCSPVLVAQQRPQHVIYTTLPPPPSQPVVVVPVVPFWAPPYTYLTQVHYYYFPDYSMYYDLSGQTYCYYDGFSWLHVTVLPSLPIYYGFNPYNAYVVVLNQSVYQPWSNHNYYEQQYPTGYYKTAYAPRTALGSNTILRAYDENQRRPLFVDKRSNREVAVKYTERPSKGYAVDNRLPQRSAIDQTSGRSRSEVNMVSDTRSTYPDRNSIRQNHGKTVPSSEPVKTFAPQVTRSEIRNNTINSPRSDYKNKRVDVVSGESRPDRIRNEVRDSRTVTSNSIVTPVNEQTTSSFYTSRKEDKRVPRTR